MRAPPLCKALCGEEGIDAPDVEDACLEYDNADGAPLFRCSSLADCSCEVQCDAAKAAVRSAYGTLDQRTVSRQGVSSF